MKKYKKNGYSLIEVVIYISLLSVVLVILFSLFQQTIFLRGKINDKAEVLDNAKFALNKIVWYIHEAEGLNAPLYGQTTNSLSINNSIPANNPIVFFIEDDTLKVQKSSNPAVPLTNDRVKVDSISFTNNSYADTQNIISISITVSSQGSFWQTSPISLQTSAKFK